TARLPAPVERLVAGDVPPAAGDQLPIPRHPRPADSFSSVDEMVERVYQGGTGRSRESFRRGVMGNSRRRSDGRWVWRWGPAQTPARHRVERGGGGAHRALTPAPPLVVPARPPPARPHQGLAEPRRPRPRPRV